MKICTHFNQVYLKLLKWKHYSKIFILIYFFMHKGQTLGNFFLFSNFFASHYVLEAKWIIFSYFSSQKYLLIIDIFGLLCSTWHVTRRQYLPTYLIITFKDKFIMKCEYDDKYTLNRNFREQGVLENIDMTNSIYNISICTYKFGSWKWNYLSIAIHLKGFLW